MSRIVDWTSGVAPLEEILRELGAGHTAIFTTFYLAGAASPTAVALVAGHVKYDGTAALRPTRRGRHSVARDEGGGRDDPFPPLDQLWTMSSRLALRARRRSGSAWAFRSAGARRLQLRLRLPASGNKASVGPGALGAFLFASVSRRAPVGAELDRSWTPAALPGGPRVIYLAKLLGTSLHPHRADRGIVFAVIDVPVLTPGIIPIVALGIRARRLARLAAVSAQTRAREVLAPLLTFPLVIPVVIAAVKATEALVQPVTNDAPWLGLLAAFAIIFVSVGALTFQYVVEE